jgi:protein required for attachment to host cells
MRFGGETRMPTTWVLIADGAKARVLVHDRKSRTLSPALQHELTGSTAQSKEIASDRQGRSFDSAGRGQSGDVGGQGRHAMEPRTDPQRYAEYAFARDLAHHLQDAANDHRFDRLVLVAAPKTLGDLRGLLPATVRKMIFAELDKDLTNVPERDLPKHLEGVLGT